MLCKNNKWLTCKPYIGHKKSKIMTSYKEYTDFFGVYQFIIFCILVFSNKYKNHYLLDSTIFEPIQKLSNTELINIKIIFYSSIYLYDLKITSLYQYFSIIKVEVFSKKWHYFIKETEIWAIIHVIISNKNNSKDNFIDYYVLNKGIYIIYMENI